MEWWPARGCASLSGCTEPLCWLTGDGAEPWLTPFFLKRLSPVWFRQHRIWEDHLLNPRARQLAHHRTLTSQIDSAHVGVCIREHWRNLANGIASTGHCLLGVLVGLFFRTGIQTSWLYCLTSFEMRSAFQINLDMCIQGRVCVCICLWGCACKQPSSYTNAYVYVKKM